MAEENKRPAKHICLTNRMPLGISSDPEYEILTALADPDVLKMVRGLSEKCVCAPFTDGVFGLDEKQANAAVRKMKNAGLICSRRVGEFHEYYLNVSRFRFLADSLRSLAKDPGSAREIES